MNQSTYRFHRLVFKPSVAIMLGVRFVASYAVWVGGPCGILRSWASCFAILSLLLFDVGFSFQETVSLPTSESSVPRFERQIDAIGLQIDMEIGLGKKWKVGSPTLVRLNCTSTQDLEGQMFLEVVDGDGVPVRYFYPDLIRFNSSETKSLEWIFRAGRGEAEAHLYWIEGAGKLESADAQNRQRKLFSFYPAELSIPLPSHQPWIIEVGDLRMGLEKGFAVRNILPRYSTSTILDVTDLPNDSAAYLGADLVALATSDLSLVESISDVQQRALTRYTQGGGRFFLSLGKNSMEVAKLAWLAELLPGTVRSVIPNVNASTIESMIGTSKQRLESLAMPVLQLKRGISDFSITLPDRQRIQVITRSGYGLGQVITFAADLNLPPLSDWEDRPALVQRLLLNQWVVQDQEQGVATATSNSYLGYDDLFGQLRASLDIFPQVRSISFSFLAVLLIVLLLILGPVEYYVWIRGINRSGWTWISLLLVVGLTSGLIVRQYDQWRPKLPLVRGVEVIDMEAATGYQRGRLWFHTYHSAPAQLNFVSQVEPFGEGIVQSLTTDWQPLPGSGIGSLESGIRSLELLPPYDAAVREAVSDQSTIRSSLVSLPFPAGSTKSLRVDWDGEGKPLGFGGLQEIPGSGMLQGEFVNPLGMELLDGVILYHNMVYPLPNRMKPGAIEKFSILSTPKDLERRLTRRVARDGKDVTAPWDPADRNSIAKLMEMIFFYEAAGGEKYTRLQHRFEPSLDMSDMLSLDRAILYARLPDSKMQITVTSPAGETVYRPEGNTFLRCILPVGRSN